MGNTFAKNNANDTINWNSIKTDKMSDNNVSGGALSNDSRLLLDRLTLDLPKNFVETETLSEVDNIFSKYQHISKVKSENELFFFINIDISLNLYFFFICREIFQNLYKT